MYNNHTKSLVPRLTLKRRDVCKVVADERSAPESFFSPPFHVFYYISAIALQPKNFPRQWHFETSKK